MQTMTQAEYENTYGVAPTAPSTSNLDISPSPRRMTMDEYTSEYGQAPGQSAPQQSQGPSIFNPLKQAVGGLGTLYGGGPEGIANKLGSDIQAGAQDMSQGNFFKGVAKSALRTAGDFAGAVYAPFGAAIQATGINKVTDKIGGAIANSSFINKITDIPAVQKFAMQHPNAGEDFGRATNIALGALDSGKIEPSTALDRTGKQITDFKGQAQNVANQATQKVSDLRAQLKDFQAQRQAASDMKETQSRANDIANVEKNYVALRKMNNFSRDSGEASRQRIAQSDVLSGAVDENGTISTKEPGGPVDQYKKQTIDGMEGVVRDNLIREGKTVNLDQVQRELTLEVNRSGLEGGDLIAAMRGIKNEIAGLKLRADELNDVPLYKIHDAKIDTTKNINYLTPPETATYRKAIARGYKTIVENVSETNVKGANAELSKYLGDIQRLEALDGKKVRGGKLGKYTAQIAGNIAGAAIGAPLGPVGAAVSTIGGGEVASYIKGKMMGNTFGEARDLGTPKNQVLEDYKAESKLPPQVDLKTPDARVGAPKGMPKTKDVLKLENDISKNVEAQKTAIKAGNFELVKTLKDIYQHLVSKLKEVVKLYKQQGERGFIRNPLSLSPKADTGPQTQLSQSSDSSTNSTTKAEDTQAFKNFDDLSTKLLGKLEGRTTVSKQFIEDMTNSADLKQPERDLFRTLLKSEGDTVNVKDFANKVKSELLPLKRLGPEDTSTSNAKMGFGGNYESTSLPGELRGPVANYQEHVFESPVKTSGANPHFRNLTDNYFAHSRVEDLPAPKTERYLGDIASGKKNYVRGKLGNENTGDTRRVIELQSDLFQKGRLEGEVASGTGIGEDAVSQLLERKKYAESLLGGKEPQDRIKNELRIVNKELARLEPEIKARQAEVSKLEPYRNTWHERVIREEVKQAAIDGKTKLQFPTGETAMKIEGLGSQENWYRADDIIHQGSVPLKEADLSVGKEIKGHGDKWIITDVLGDGKFKAVQKDMGDFHAEDGVMQGFNDAGDEIDVPIPESMKETFDISGKVDTNNPIYKFYEKEVGRYLKNKYDAQLVTDSQGVKWWEVKVDKSMKKLPVEAFALAPLALMNNKKK